MGLEDMESRVTASRSGKQYEEQPHQVHMRFIKQHLSSRNMSWNQFGSYIKNPNYPLSGTRKQKIEKTALAIDKDPANLDSIIEHMKGT
jgi:hypothetical protein